MNIKDIADVMEDIRAEQEATKEARLEIERKAECAAEWNARRAQKNALIEKLLPYLVGHHDEEKATLTIDGVDVTYRFGLEQEYTSRGRGSWGSKATGKYRVVVDVPDSKYNRQTGRSYDSTRRQSYPERKDGTHNYKEIARHIVDYAARQNTSNKLERTRAANEAVAVATRDSCGVGEYDHFEIRASQSAEKPVFVKWTIGRSMTADEARALHAALKSLGLVE